MSVEPVSPDAFAHPFVRGVEEIARAVADVSSRPDLMSAPEKAHALLELARLESEVAGLRLRVLGCADDLAAAHGSRDAASWLAHEARLDRGPVRRDGELATALTQRWARVESALIGGAVNLPQARACADVLAELPDDLDPTLVDAVEEQLVTLAADWPPKDLRILGRKVLEAIDPEAADAHEARRLDDEERRAHEATSLTFAHLADGRTRVIATMPDAAANRLATYLDASPVPGTRPQPAASRRRPPPSHADRLGSSAARLS